MHHATSRPRTNTNNLRPASDKVQDTATTPDHHDDIKCRGRTQLDMAILNRKIEALLDSKRYEADYYASL